MWAQWCIASLLVLVSKAAPVSHQPAAYSVDLSLPPAQRWNRVLEDVIAREGTKPFFDYFTAVLDSLRQKHNESYSFYLANAGEFEQAFSREAPDALGEIFVLADTLYAHATSDVERQVFQRNQVFMVQVAMQLINMGPAGGECTSILARRPDGEVMHFRNWDFVPLPDVLGQLSVVVDFHFGQNRGFRCLLAMTHIDKWTTCLKPGRFSMSLNAREYGQRFERGREASVELQLLQAGHIPRQLLLRKVMMSESYEEALAMAVSARMLTSMYLILGAPAARGSSDGRGAVLTLFGNGSSADVMPLPPREDGWFLVQTNVDHWLPMSEERTSSHRREHVKALMRQLGPNATEEQLYSVLQNEEEFPAGHTGKDSGKVFRPVTIASALMWPARAADKSWAADVWRPGSSSPMTSLHI